MHINLILWVPVLVMVVVAVATDLRSRRIPNWLTLPCLVGGVIVNCSIAGFAGLGRSLGGLTLAVLILGGLCWFNTLGMGDLKLCAAAGAWIGPSALMFALLITAMAGGLIAVAYACWARKLGSVLDATASVLMQAPFPREGHRASRGISHRDAFTIPYAPAIAIGVVFSFLAN
jgi:prepilin peptidase CpaA